MTREAKVGLLLGLVFIVAIAMVLRGIHQSGQSEMAETGLTQTYTEPTSENPLSDVVNLSVAVDKLSNPGEAGSEPVEEPAPAANVESQPRYVQVLPSTNVSHDVATAAESPVTMPAMTPVTIPAVMESPVRESNPEVSAVTVQVPDGRFERALDQITTPVSNPSILSGAEAVVSPKAGKVYEVQEGDHLTKIAMRMYGEQEGKKKSNIDRIYQANKQEMRSENDLWIGQKLVIPELPKSAMRSPSRSAKPAEPAKAAENASTRSAKVTSTRTYVVKDGDSLWKIAQKELGNGSRFSEIEKLNAKTLKKGNNLWVGMKLDLPAQ